MTSRMAEVLLAATFLVILHAIYAFSLILLPKNAIIARIASILPLSAAAYAVYIYGIKSSTGGPPEQHQAVLLTLFVVHYLGLVQCIVLVRIDSAKLSELALKHNKHNTISNTRSGESSSGSSNSSSQNGNHEPSVSFSADSVISTPQKVWEALSLCSNARRLGTEWQVKNVFYRTGPPQTRAGFVINALPKAALAYLLIDAMALLPPPEAHLVTEEKQTPWHLWTLTGEDVAFRISAVIMFWVVARLVIYVSVQGILGVVSVGLGLSSPSYWQPLFGPLRELYTIRGFWGSFWHQCLRNILTGFGHFIPDSILFIPRGTLLSRYTRLYLVFFLSGLIHHPADIVQGVPLRRTTASLGFFMLQPLGIMAEDGVQALTKTWPIPRAVRTVAGYVWVFFFLFATTPRWMFPLTRLDLPQSLVPFSVDTPLMKYFPAAKS